MNKLLLSFCLITTTAFAGKTQQKRLTDDIARGTVTPPKFVDWFPDQLVLNIAGQKYTDIRGVHRISKDLQVLRLQNNRLSHLPSTIACLEKLRHLDVTSNKLVSVPREIQYLKQLEHLDFESNNLSAFPVGLTGCQQLQNLSLSCNKITHIPAEIAYLKNLDRFAIGANPLKSVDPAFTQLNKLRLLNIDAEQAHLFAPLVARMTHLKNIVLAKHRASLQDFLTIYFDIVDSFIPFSARLTHLKNVAWAKHCASVGDGFYDDLVKTYFPNYRRVSDPILERADHLMLERKG